MGKINELWILWRKFTLKETLIATISFLMGGVVGMLIVLILS